MLFRADWLTAGSFEPVYPEKHPDCCTKLTYFLFFALSEADNNELFVNINTTTSDVGDVGKLAQEIKYLIGMDLSEMRKNSWVYCSEYFNKKSLMDQMDEYFGVKEKP